MKQVTLTRPFLNQLVATSYGIPTECVSPASSKATELLLKALFESLFDTRLVITE